VAIGLRMNVAEMFMCCSANLDRHHRA